jgi:hypothetical protein
LTGGNPRHDVYVFNGSSSTANVSVNILDKTGNNLLGHPIPGTNPVQNYPGHANGATVPVAAANTLSINWASPATAPPDSDGITNVSFAVRVTSDQPIVVGHDFRWGDFVSIPCTQLPK